VHSSAGFVSPNFIAVGTNSMLKKAPMEVGACYKLEIMAKSLMNQS